MLCANSLIGLAALSEHREFGSLSQHFADVTRYIQCKCTLLHTKTVILILLAALFVPLPNIAEIDE